MSQHPLFPACQEEPEKADATVNSRLLRVTLCWGAQVHMFEETAPLRGPAFLQVWGRGWGDKNVIHIACVPKTLVFTAFPPFCTTYRTRKSITSAHAFRDHAQNTYLQRLCPKHWYLQRVNILHKEVEQENLSQASMPFATLPRTLVFTAFYAQKTGLDCVTL